MLRWIEDLRGSESDEPSSNTSMVNLFDMSIRNSSLEDGAVMLYKCFTSLTGIRRNQRLLPEPSGSKAKFKMCSLTCTGLDQAACRLSVFLHVFACFCISFSIKLCQKVPGSSNSSASNVSSAPGRDPSSRFEHQSLSLPEVLETPLPWMAMFRTVRCRSWFHFHFFLSLSRLNS